MIYQIFPKQDSTVYEKKDDLNSGLDSLLEINKLLEGIADQNNVVTNEAYSSRILMKFDYSDLNPLIEAGCNTSSVDNKYYLKMYATQEKQLPSSFTLEVNSISGSWNMGLGRYDYSPYITEGVSWLYRFDKEEGTKWSTGSFGTTGATGSWNMNPGGCTWYTSSNYTVTKSFNFNESIDPYIDITKIVNAHLSSSIVNDGILIRRPTIEENSITDEMQLAFFSSDTNTIYLPSLHVKWNDWSFNTGSLSPLTDTTENVIAFRNLRNTYYTNDRVKFRLSGRPKYPIKTFATSSAYSYQYYLPASSSYEIEDLHTKDIVIPHDDIYTRISCDSTSNFFNFWMNGLQPERWYKLNIKCKFNSNDIRIYNHNFIFKVERGV